MFNWFQRLLPQTGDFFGMFERHAATLVGASDALHQLVDGGSGDAACLRQIHDLEHEADEIIRQVLTSVRRTFLTPFDRGAIISLIGAMDDAIDEMQSAARAVDVYGITSFEPEMKEMVAMIRDAAVLTAEAVPLMRDISRNGSRIHMITERIVRLESAADVVHATGLKRSFQEQADRKPMTFVVSREIYKHLERITDAFEDVANEIDGIVIDHA